MQIAGMESMIAYRPMRAKPSAKKGFTMRISQSTLSLQSQSTQYASLHTEEKLEFALRTAPPSTSEVVISDAARDTLAASQQTEERRDQSDTQRTVDPRLQLLISLIERLTGRKIQLFDASALAAHQDSVQDANTAASRNETAEPPQAEWSLHFEHREVREEAQAVRFHANGVATTADGREISFALDLQMARYERSESLTTVDAGNMRRKDPLILNLQGGAATLTSQRVAFDLDANPDTPTEMIAKPGQGSMLLAFDKNANGKIDDGSELFGPATGNGFGELSQLDSDHNGWIDEADAAYAQLKLWSPGATPQSLATAGVGAITLQQAATNFALREGQDDRGQIQSTGIFLNEDGRPGTIQHVDLTV